MSSTPQSGTTQVTIRHPNDVINVDSTRKHHTLHNLVAYLEAVEIGAKGVGGSIDVQQSTSATVPVVGPCGSDAVSATGTVTISSGTGTIGATINGVSITTTWATSDTATAAALATAINASANALVKGLVAATSTLGIVTITASRPGIYGNCVTLAASGTGATASGTRLTGGVDATAKTLTF